MTHSGGQPHSSVGDMGQRYEVRAHGYPKPGVNTIGWSTDLKGAHRLREIIGQAPGCTAAVVYDRQEKCFAIDQGTLIQQLRRNAAAEDHRGAGGLLSEAASEIEKLHDALRHARACQVCADGDWSDCESGHEALMLLGLAKTED